MKLKNKKIIVGTALSLGLSHSIGDSELTIPEPLEIKVEPIQDPRNLEYVKKLIQDSGVKYPYTTFLQMREESGNGSSLLATEYSSLFGMKMPRVRKTLAIGETKSGYAIFNSIEDSVLDFKLWQESIPSKYLNSKREYIKYLRKVYSKNENYLRNFGIK